MIQGIIPVVVADFSVAAGIVLSSQEEAGDDKEDLHGNFRAGRKIRAEMEESHHIGEVQFQYIQRIDPFHWVTSKRNFSALVIEVIVGNDLGAVGIAQGVAVFVVFPGFCECFAAVDIKPSGGNVLTLAVIFVYVEAGQFSG